MRNHMFHIFVFCTFGILFSSCGEQGGCVVFPLGDTLDIRYASHLQMVERENYTVVNLRNPWDTLQILHTYVLVPHGEVYDADSLPEGTVVRVPLQRSIIYTAVHCGLVEELGAVDAVAGVCDARYIHQSMVKSMLADGRISDLGNSMNPDVERMISIRPDALLLSPFENSSPAVFKEWEINTPISK